MATARKQPANEETGEDGIRGRVRFDTDVSVIDWIDEGGQIHFIDVGHTCMGPGHAVFVHL